MESDNVDAKSSRSEQEKLPLIDGKQQSKKWTVFGAILALTSGLLYSIKDILIKKFQVNFVDNVFIQSMMITILSVTVVKLGRKNLLLDSSEGEKTIQKYVILVGVGILNGLNMMCYFLGVLYIPLGDALTIIYTGPMFTMIFSYIFLGTKQGLWKLSCTLLLLVGVTLAVRPPFIFSQTDLHIQENNQTILVRTISFRELSTSLDNKEGFHWIGVLLCFGAASLGGLSNVATNHLKDIPSGTLMFWKGFISIFCGFLFLSFDKGSQIFIQKDIDSTAIGKLFLLASIDITATWIATVSYQLLDPTICSVLLKNSLLLL